MKAVDTNVLVRFLVVDDAAQAARARQIVTGATDPLFVSDLALAELVWVLRARYRRPRDEVISVVGALLSTPTFTYEDRELLVRAHLAWSSGRGDFADYVQREHGLRAGCEALVTFDEALDEEGFERA